MTSPLTPKRKAGKGPKVSPSDKGDGEKSPLLEQHSFRHHNRANKTFRQVQRVSKQAALASKRKIWDSNDASIDVAQTAVDHWENTYTALRGLLVASAHSAQSLYGAAKAGVNGLEHGLLVPVRDWVLLPTFWGVERVAGETVGFLQSPQAAQVADASLGVVRQVPFVGDNLLAPALVKSVQLAKAAWHVAQYPIPSKTAVRESVDFAMTGTKWALSTAGREIYFYAKIVDANITRTLMHTQWKVLGSGPYATLDKINKGEVIDHLCERYFSLGDVIHRYELAAHIRAHNEKLYHDLVLTGLLRDRGGKLTEDDEWLSPCPCYRSLDAPFLLPTTDSTDAVPTEITPLWFKLPSQNGKRPLKDVPWVRLPDGDKLEQRYLAVVASTQNGQNDMGCAKSTEDDRDNCRVRPNETESVEDCHPPGNDDSAPDAATHRYPTVAQWYDPNMEQDILVDQKRHAVSFLACCPRCRVQHGDWRPPLVETKYGSFCSDCSEADDSKVPVDTLFLPPPVNMLMKPTMWRFHGLGDQVHRAVWFVDTKRHGLQPYSEASAAVLEDAYLYLKWKMSKRSQAEDGLDGELLTVEVLSPNGAETQLVQFRSLTQATAIQKTLGGAISLFKRRVYRGAVSTTAAEEVSSISKNPVVDLDESLSVADKDGQVSIDDTRRVETTTAGIEHADAVDSAFSPAVPTSHETCINCEEKETCGDEDITDHPMLGRIDASVSLAVPASHATSITDEVREACGGEDDIDHLVLVVHGIGEMLRTIDLFGMSLPTLSSIVDCCRFLRTNHAQIHAAEGDFIQGRVEYLPVEWHEAFALQSQRQPRPDLSSAALVKGSRSSNATMNDISLRTIPQMRAFANDTLMDVLYFMSPEHHDKIIDIVISEMNFVVNKFRCLTGFSGKISVIGHSLGSVIAWDILESQVPESGVPETYEPISPLNGGSIQSPAGSSSNSSVSQTPITPNLPLHSDSSSQFSESDNGCPESSSPEEINVQMLKYRQLSFPVQNAFMLGSPIPVFLMIRNQHKPLSGKFSLSGCRRVFNIFHPYDPVAYRIEPLLDPRNADIEPRIITHWNGGFRVHYQTKILWKKLVDETWKTQQNVINAVEAQIAGLGLLDGAIDVVFEDEEELSEIGSEDNRLDYVNCGNLNQGSRIDYMLQEKEIENANEYVAALAAHSSYWMEKDLSLFVARQIYCCRNEATDRRSIENEPITPRSDTVDL